MTGASAEAHFELVDTTEKLSGACEQLSAESGSLFIDTEFESNKRGTKLCLVQISAGTSSYLIDPLKLSDLSRLRQLLGQPRRQWVLHAGSQDVWLLMRELDVPMPEQLFDTQIAWGLLSPEASVSLAYLQYRLLGLRSAKGHQADDWVRRPLPSSQLAYAASDVSHLPAMAQQLQQQAEGKQRLDIIREASRDALSPEKPPPPPLRLASFRNAWQLDEGSQAGLLFLIDWYNSLGDRERSRAPDTKVLLSIAARLPTSVKDLARIKGTGHGFVSQHGSHVVTGLRRAAQQSNAEHFEPLAPPSYATYEEIELEAWLVSMRAQLCVRGEFAPELAIPARLLKALQAAVLVHGPSRLTAPLSGWRRDLLAADMEKYQHEHPLPSSSLPG